MFACSCVRVFVCPCVRVSVCVHVCVSCSSLFAGMFCGLVVLWYVYVLWLFYGVRMFCGLVVRRCMLLIVVVVVVVVVVLSAAACTVELGFPCCLDTLQRGVQWIGGAVDWGSIV